MAYDNDKELLSAEDYAKVQAYKEAWANATTQEERDAAHAGAEAIRAKSTWNYSGGDDGGKYIPLGSQDSYSGGSSYRSSGTSSSGSGGGTAYGANLAAQQALLNQWKAAALQQANAQIDYGVSTGTKDLERALQDAQPQFQEQAESVARDERQGMDNSALYAELRGDKGGIGQSQYNEIQASAAQNKLAVQQAQTQLSTDTARQIEDLRAQGEFQKADAALQISQQYLSQLMSLEQWAAEYNLSAAQFEASLQQWQQNYQLSMAQLQQNQSQFNANLKYKYDALGQDQSQYQAKQLASLGQALLSAGIMPNDAQLSAMGMTGDQATQYIQAAQLAAASKGSSSKSGSSKSNSGGSGTNETDILVEDAINWAAKTGGDPIEFINRYYDNYNTTKTAALSGLNVWSSQTTGMDSNRFDELLRNIDLTARNAASESVDASVANIVNSVLSQLTLEQRKRLYAKLGQYYNIG